ncbi:MAG: UDP-glucose 4-epimerase GalE [Eubacterium sp.]
MIFLVTGGAGFIGSHTCVELLNAGYEVVIVDNLYNASEKVIGRIEEFTGKSVKFYKADVRDAKALDEIFAKEAVEAVIHFAGLKAVGESVAKPLEYYDNNINGTLTLCDVMRKHDVKNIIFSSSATVYGDPAFIPITEECPKGICTNPYGWTKWMLEQILTDLHTADKDWNVVLLRYFNPIGAHKSGKMGKIRKEFRIILCPILRRLRSENCSVSGYLGMITIHRMEPVCAITFT